MSAPAAVFRRAAHLSLALALAGAPGSLRAEETVEWSGGKWFTGQSFEARTMWSVGKTLSTRRPSRIDRRVDLRGGYVTPAFGDAHHHGIDGEAGLDAKIEAFHCAGIFYVKNPNVIPDFLTPAVRARLGRSDGLDVVFAHGGFTNVGGHPGPLHGRLAGAGVFPGLGPADMAGRAYTEIADPRALAVAWPRFLRGGPDFVKLFVNGGARHDAERAGGSAPRLSLALMKRLVRLSHRAGLRVTAHIETAADFSDAVRAGVDEMAHAPLVDPRAPDIGVYRLDPRSSAHAARRGVTVVLTASVLPRFSKGRWTDEMHARTRELQARNIRTLSAAGVPLAIGSDGISGETPFVTARDEARYLHDHRLLTNLELLKSWSETTPATIFPGRRIGRLHDGYEADFLVLDADPLRDWSAVDRISLRVRGGQEIVPRCGARV